MYSILLSEDERWVRAAIKHTVERTGLPFQVLGECGTGLEALDWLNAHSADLILTDIRMPVMDGLTFVSELRARGFGTPVVMISGHDDFAYVQQALRTGVFDYLLKPVEKEDMKTCLGKWLEHKVKEEEAAPVGKHTELSAVEQVMAYVRSNLSKDVTLTDAAAMVFLNPSYLSQLFKQQTNRNFSDFVSEERMREAKRLLTLTSLRISEVAVRTGYSDVAYFGSVFKRMTGQTPSEYRKHHPSGKLLS